MLSLLTLNIGAAARERAERLVGWLSGRPEDVFLLTETSGGEGTAYLLDRFRSAGYAVVKTRDDGDRGAALVSRVPMLDTPVALGPLTIPGRAAAAVLDTEPRVCVVAVYVPSRDRSVTKIERKQQFLESLLGGLKTLPAAERTALLMGGDYNLISRTHQPAHRGFLPFEFEFLEALEASGLVDAHAHCRPGVQAHSWIGRTGDGYRYDYFHVGGALASRLGDCTYLHDTRDQRLTDHAAVTLTLQVEARRLDTGDPASSDEMTLF